MANVYDQFDDVANPYDRFDTAPRVSPEPKGATTQRDFVEERSFIDDLGRNTAVVVRGALEAPIEFAGLFTDPVTSLSNRYLGTNIPLSRETAEGLVDYTGLPKPETTQERVVNTAAKVMSGVGGQNTLAQALFRNAGPVATAVTQQFTANPLSQLIGAASGGVASQAAQELDLGPWGQLVAGLAGSMAGSAATVPARKMVNSLGRNWAMFKAGRQGREQALSRVKGILEDGGIDTSTIPAGELDDIIKEVAIAFERGKSINPDVVRRIARYSTIPNAVPTTGRVTLDPREITREKNAAKYGANSSSSKLKLLSDVENNNNAALIDDLNRMGADQATDTVTAGVNLKSTLQDIDKPRATLVSEAYQRVKDHAGRSARMDNNAFSNKANDLLERNQLGPFLPAEIRSILNGVSDGSVPFTANTVMQFDKIMSTAQRSTRDNNARAAIGFVRDALNNTPVHSSAGKKAINQYRKARTLARKRFELIERNPALEASLADEAPDKFIQKFIVGDGSKSNLRDVAQLSRELKKNAPEMHEAARRQILLYLKNKALGGMPDEVGKFSASNFNRAFERLGMGKLAQFFTKREIAHLKAIRDVSAYEVVQPRGAAINNSNTASAAARIAQSQTLSGIPLGQLLQAPARYVTESRAANNAMDVLSAITGKQGTESRIPLGTALPLLMNAVNSQSAP
ncbi:MAG: hypothetical protein K1563_07840 [Candidatus Thiodiazotropha sp. (ex. Lucinisca nassula)]|nr:hypothetical protein [Candidatus Thiodiazotropha sp. (ex. Lucinisca nassula)]MBW9273585.1 hypothetical protein [Candidatus Thiodiazotropha sp. (ex. Lucinisca nassula)]